MIYGKFHYYDLIYKITIPSECYRACEHNGGCWPTTLNFLKFHFGNNNFIVEHSIAGYLPLKFDATWNLGNLLTLSFGLSTGWATINLLELENANSTFPTGPLTKQETSLVISLINVGGFVGNWLVLPLSGLVGVKRATHLLGIPIVVRWIFMKLENIFHSLIFFILVYFHDIVVWFNSNNFRRECVLLICVQIVYRAGWWRFECVDFNAH